MKHFLSILLIFSLLFGCFANAETLIDDAGRSITLNQPPERIISGYYISTSALIALGLKDKLVGIEAKADKRPLYALCAKELITLPNVGSAKQFDVEGCLALKPDLVILPLKLSDKAELLSSMGIAVLLVNPEDQLLLQNDISMIAKACGVDATLLLSDMNRLKEQLDTIVNGLSKPTVYLGGNSSFLSTSGRNMYQSWLVTAAGAQNVAEELTDKSWQSISYEQLLSWNPEYIVLASDASYTVEDVLNDENLSMLQAVQNQHVLQMPGDIEAWDSPVPGSILGALWLAGQIHPETEADILFQNGVSSFYGTWYNLYVQKE